MKPPITKRMIVMTVPIPYPYEAISWGRRSFMNPITVMRAATTPAIMNKTPTVPATEPSLFVAYTQCNYLTNQIKR